ncbi:MAG: AAA family ATPase [Gemmatimonadaceae bacterium]|nr:AAA family ATPase [Gemmatimonadaceae bacterium]
MTLYLRTLGSAALLDSTAEAGAGEPRVVLGPGKALAVLVYLSVAGRSVTRESLLDLLWSDVPPSQARPALRQALFLLRRLLGDEALVGAEELSLVRPLPGDRDTFLRALDRDALDDAVAAYGGAFLPGFAIPGAARFEHWADLERDRLEQGYLGAAELLVRRALNAGRAAEARERAREVRTITPHREESARLVIEVALSVNDGVTALMEANALQLWAEREGVALEGSTRALLARVHGPTPSDEANTDEPPQLTAELTGREREFATLIGAWQAARRAPARRVHLSAAAGVGKSRLLREVLARAAAGGARIVSVGGRMGDREVPFAFVSDLAAAIAELPGSLGIAPASASALVALNPTLSRRYNTAPEPTTGEEASRRWLMALVDLVHAVADEQRFILAVDDLHWIDADSLRLLDGLWSRLGDARVLALTASRPERAPLAGTTEVLSLLPLSAANVGALVSSLGDPTTVWSDARVAQLHAATGGSPLLVLETLRLALDRRALALEQRAWRVLDDAACSALLQGGGALRQRVEAIPADARWLLLLLATAGAPVDRLVLAQAAGCEPAALAAPLDVLERTGIITRITGGWIPAHDELADVVRTASATADQQRAHAAIGVAFMRSAEERAFESGLARRALRHLLLAGESGEAQSLFRRLLLRAREQRDRRPARDVAADWLAGALDGQLPLDRGAIDLLARAEPRSWRVGLWSPLRRGLAATALLALGGFTVVSWRARADRLAHEQRLLYVMPSLEVSQVGVSPERWGTTRTLVAKPVSVGGDGRQIAQEALIHPDLSVHQSPDQQSMAWTHDSGDSTTLDIWLRTPAGLRRLTKGIRDDVVSDWLPDGSALLGASSRWSSPEHGHYNIAVFDTATGVARAVTHGPFHENSAHISPDGTRIAFVREGGSNGPEVCVVDVDGAVEPECRRILSYTSAVIGWAGLDELVLLGQSNTERPLFAYDWTRATVRRLLGPTVVTAALSRDGKYAVASLRGNGGVGIRDWVIPLDRPTDAHVVETVDERAVDVRWWEGGSDRSLLVTHLTFSDSSRVLPLGASTRLHVVPRGDGGQPIATPARVRWRSLDTTIAIVTPDGEVIPRRPGAVEIEASLAGWRSVRARFAVRGSLHRALLHEAWTPDWSGRWFAWGEPRPVVVPGPGGLPVLWSRGDGAYVSAAISRQQWSADSGLGFEVRVSTPFNGTANQRIRAMLLGGLDSSRIVQANPNGSLPASVIPSTLCGLTFPDEGEWGKRHFAFVGGTPLDFDAGPFADSLRTGQWWTLRIQILADGRCGVAINGRVLYISAEPVARRLQYRLRLGDEAKGALLAFGPVDLWTGVRTDVVWQTPPDRPR